PYQSQYSLVCYLLRNKVHELIMIDPVKELLQIDIYDHSVARIDVLRGLSYRMVCILIRTEAVAVGRKSHFKYGSEYLVYSLLYHMVYYREYFQFSCTTI